MLKVLYVIDDLLRAGAQRQLYQMIRNADKSKFEIHLIYFTEVEAGMDEFHSLCANVCYVKRKYRWDPSPIHSLTRYINQYNIDIVHTHLFMSTFYGVIASCITHRPVVNQYVHNVTEEKYYRLLIMRLIFRFSDLIFTSSVFGLRAFRLQNKNNAFVINNMFDFSVTKEYEREKILNKYELTGFDYIVCMIGNFTIWKDYKTYFEMAKIILQSNPRVLFLSVGDGKYRHQYESMIELFGIKSNVFLLGTIADVYEIISIIDIGVLFSSPRYGEAQSFVIGEYMYQKKPVVASALGGIPETVEDNFTGFLVPPSDPRSAALKVVKLMYDAELRRTFGENGYNLLYKRFNSRQIMEQIQQHYLRLVKESRL